MPFVGWYTHYSLFFWNQTSRLIRQKSFTEKAVSTLKIIDKRVPPQKKYRQSWLVNLPPARNKGLKFNESFFSVWVGEMLGGVGWTATTKANLLQTLTGSLGNICFQPWDQVAILAYQWMLWHLLQKVCQLTWVVHWKKHNVLFGLLGNKKMYTYL